MYARPPGVLPATCSSTLRTVSCSRTWCITASTGLAGAWRRRTSSPERWALPSEAFSGPCGLIKNPGFLGREDGKWKESMWVVVGIWVQTQPHLLCSPGNTADSESVASSAKWGWYSQPCQHSAWDVAGTKIPVHACLLPSPPLSSSLLAFVLLPRDPQPELPLGSLGQDWQIWGTW